MGTPQLADLVQETANAPGTGAFTLGGAPAGRQTFADAFPAGGEVFYYASDGTQTEWGIGTLHVGSPNVLTRTTVLGNLFGSKTALNFSSSVMIWNEVPSGRMAFQDDAGQLPVSGNPDFTRDVALSAKAAEARYVKGGGGSNDYAPLYTGVQKATGRMWASYQNDSGAVVAALAATPADLSSAVGTETQARIAADALNAKLSGGNPFIGDQSISGNLSTTGNISASGNVIIGNGRQLFIKDANGAGSEYLQTEYYASGGMTGLNAVTHLLDSSGKPMQWMALRGADGSVLTSAGQLAFTSQLPFSDPSIKMQVFTGQTGDNTLPTAFSLILGIQLTAILTSTPSDEWFLYGAKANGGTSITIYGSSYSFYITVYGRY